MDVAFYISELLYTNDCVILPDFGGFVSQYAPAKIHPINHTFYPPSKQVLFNSKLTRDDGLLIDFIAQKENLDYGNAKKVVAAFVRSLNEQVEQGNKLTLDKIGTIRKDVEGKLLFDPDPEVNYLEDAFGLDSFISPPVIRKSLYKRKEGLFADRKQVKGNDTKRRKAILAAMAVIPILLLVGWFVIKGTKTPEPVQQSSMLDITNTEREMPVQTKEIIPEKTPPLETLNLSEGLEENAPDEIKQQPVKPSRNYYIIGGTFGEETNADKLVRLLIQKGYDASRAGISPSSGLHMVSYMITPDKDEALVNLAIIRRDDNTSAWLIRK